MQTQNNNPVLPGKFIVSIDGKNQSFTSEDLTTKLLLNDDHSRYLVQQAKSLSDGFYKTGALAATVVVGEDIPYLYLKDNVTAEVFLRVLRVRYPLRSQKVEFETVLRVLSNHNSNSPYTHANIDLTFDDIERLAVVYGVTVVVKPVQREIFNVAFRRGDYTISRLQQLLEARGRKTDVGHVIGMLDPDRKLGITAHTILSREDIRYLAYRLDFKAHFKFGLRRMH